MPLGLPTVVTPSSCHPLCVVGYSVLLGMAASTGSPIYSNFTLLESPSILPVPGPICVSRSTHSPCYLASLLPGMPVFPLPHLCHAHSYRSLVPAVTCLSTSGWGWGSSRHGHHGSHKQAKPPEPREALGTPAHTEWTPSRERACALSLFL